MLLLPKRYLFMNGKKRSWPEERPTLSRTPPPDSLGKKSNEGSEVVMAAELIIAPEAEQDLAEAYAWYECENGDAVKL